MSTRISSPVPQILRETELFLERNFVKIAFAVSALAMLILVPLQFFLGCAIGFALQGMMDAKLIPSENLIPPTLFSIVGATAALLRLTPAGASGGLIFRTIPLLGSVSVGIIANQMARM